MHERDVATSIAAKMFLKWSHVKQQVMLSDKQGKNQGRTGFIGLQTLLQILGHLDITLDHKETKWIRAKYGAGDDDIEYTEFLNEIFTKGSERRRTPQTPKGKMAVTARNTTKMAAIYFAMMHQFSHVWKSFRQKCKESTHSSVIPVRTFRSLLEAHGILLSESNLFTIIAVFSVTPETNLKGAPSELLVDYEKFVSGFLKELYAHQHGGYGAENMWQDGDFGGRPDLSTMQARFRP